MQSETTRVMIVEDDSEVAESVAEPLRHNGYVVEIARDGQVALERSLDEDFTVTIMDVHLPVMSGADSCVAIKRAKPEARVVMMTGLEEWVSGNAARLGAEGLLRKPFHPEALLKLVDPERSR
jgi:DNA-binding response OmpR family regulator